MDGIFDFCRTAASLGYVLVVATNQAGIARGLYTEADFQHLSRWMLKQFEEAAIQLTAIYHCPYHGQHGLGRYRRDSHDRKPNPGMLIRAAIEHSISLGESIMVGDKETDMLAGYNAGILRRYLLGGPPTAPGQRFATHLVRSVPELTDCFLLDHSRRQSRHQKPP